MTTPNNDRLPMPLICECGFNTMSASAAHSHALEHERKEIQTLYADFIAHNTAAGELTFICLDCYRAGGTVLQNHHRPFGITPEQLNDAGGWIACEYCEAACTQIG